MKDQQGLVNECLASLEEEDFCIIYPDTDYDNEEEFEDEEDEEQETD